MTSTRVLALAVAWALIISGSGCGGGDSSTTSPATTCTPLDGTPWVPNVPGVADTNHDSSTAVTRTEINQTGPLIGLHADPTSSGDVTTVTFSVPSDLGANGSVSLVAQVTNLPTQLSNSDAYAVLVSLSDGANEFVNLQNTGQACSGGITSSGFYCCTSTGCSPSSRWTIGSPSAFFSYDYWQQFQFGVVAPVGVNSFPNCNWTGGSPDTCFFADGTKFTGNKLNPGTYTAKYAMISDSSGMLSSAPLSANLKLELIQKTDGHAGGGLDVNVILVGTNNVKASRTAKGQQNLNELLKNFYGQYAQSNTGVKIGKITSVEWGCDTGGDKYASVAVSDLHSMFAGGNSVIPSSTDGKAVNLYFVSSITDGSSSSLTIAGLAGGILGPMMNGTGASGVAIATFDSLDSFNPSCTDPTSCPLSSQESSFIDMGGTIAHETGHYLGLNHPSESDGTVQDHVPDTPQCTKTDSKLGYITAASCLTDPSLLSTSGKTCADNCAGYDPGAGQFCPTATECQFNHVMWWTSKTYANGTGDGNLFSVDSSAIINYSPYVQ